MRGGPLGGAHTGRSAVIGLAHGERRREKETNQYNIIGRWTNILRRFVR
jgi:hypothetical protein